MERERETEIKRESDLYQERGRQIERERETNGKREGDR